MSGVIDPEYAKTLEAENRRLRKENRALRRASDTDVTTHVHTKRAAMEHLAGKLEESFRNSTHSGDPRIMVSVGMFDLDHFKKINDTHGHPAGDDALLSVGKHLNKNRRRSDYYGRWGGEEFLLICPSDNLYGIYSTADRMREGIKENFRGLYERRLDSGETVSGITLSGGVVSASDAGEIMLILGKSGKEILYRLRDAGGNPEEIKSYIEKFSAISGIECSIVDSWVRRLSDALKENDYDSLGKDDFGVAGNLLTNYADRAAYFSKKHGRDMVTAYRSDGFGRFVHPENGTLWVPVR